MLAAVDLAYPFEGRWLTQNSPANRVPSHGTALFATSFAIDFVPVNEAGRTAPITFGVASAPRTGGAVSWLRAAHPRARPRRGRRRA